jgi:small subunit ribosomal protein S17
MKALVGKVVSNKMKNTLVVEMDRLLSHPLYNKRMRRTSKYHVHADKPVTVGETVKFVATKPISKTKFYKLWSK